MARSASACVAVASPAWIDPPLTTPGGNPVIDVPGLTPTSPTMVVAPVLVTVVPPRTAKLAAAPRGGAVAIKIRSSNRSIASDDRDLRRLAARPGAGLAIRHARQSEKIIGESS